MSAPHYSDSIVNLTKPGLYSIYNDSKNNLLKDINDNDIYQDLNVNINKTNTPNTQSAAKVLDSTRKLGTGRILFNLFILGICGILYSEIAKHIHDNHILVPYLAAEPLVIGNNIILKILSNFNIQSNSQICPYLITMTEGVCLGLIQPVADYLLPKSFSSNQRNDLNLNEIVRASITLLGVSFGVRKIEWNSSVQVALAWSLLNPCLWLLLDSTISGFISSSLAAFGASYLAYYYHPNKFVSSNSHNVLAIWLWLGSFFFCGLIIFGKIGRFLFKR